MGAKVLISYFPKSLRAKRIFTYADLDHQGPLCVHLCYADLDHPDHYCYDRLSLGDIYLC